MSQTLSPRDRQAPVAAQAGSPHQNDAPSEMTARERGRLKGLTDAEGEAERAPKEASVTAPPKWKPAEVAAIRHNVFRTDDDLVNTVASARGDALGKAGIGISQDSVSSDPILDALIESAAIALSAATGGIFGAAAGGLASKMGKLATSNTGARLVAGVRKLASSAGEGKVKSPVEAEIRSFSGEALDSALFMKGLEKGARAQQVQVMNAVPDPESLSEELVANPHGLAISTALRAAALVAGDSAQGVQYTSAIAQWSNYIHKGSGRETNEQGVLVVTVDGVGAIQSARLDGLSKLARAELTAQGGTVGHFDVVIRIEGAGVRIASRPGERATPDFDPTGMTPTVMQAWYRNWKKAGNVEGDEDTLALVGAFLGDLWSKGLRELGGIGE